VGISSPGIGSNIPVNDIVSKLMTAESAPLADYDKKSASYLAQVSAFGNLSSALGTFQSSLSSLTSLSGFQTMTAAPGDSSIFTATTDSTAKAGSYRINISQIAQAQTLASTGYKTTTAAIGLGAKTTINFALGTVSGGSFGVTGTALGASLTTGGIAAGSLTINGTAIATDGTTRSAKQLAAAINAQTEKTGVSATAAATSTAPPVRQRRRQPASAPSRPAPAAAIRCRSAASRSAALGGQHRHPASAPATSTGRLLTGTSPSTQALAAANITFTGKAADGTLRFTAADGSEHRHHRNRPARTSRAA
jgi:flagellar hook-associated protein 2